jgi:NADPH2:quinone reductase
VPEESLVELPDEADGDLAAALGVVGITALLALDRAAPVDGRRVLVLGATGAVGQMAVQLAKQMGAGRVVGAGRSGERLERGRELGADKVVELGDRAAGGPLDIVIDSLWGEPAMAALRVIATEGRLVNVGQSAGADVRVPLESVRNRQGTIHAISSGWTPLERKAEAYRCVLDLAVAGDLTVDREVVPLDEVAAAWERQEESPGKKLVVSIGQA